MKYIKLAVAFLSVVLLGGCASTSSVDLPDNYWESSEDKKVVIAFVKQPEMAALRSGGQGLLDMAINEAMTNTVETHLSSLSYEKLESRKSRIAEALKKRGVTEAIVLPNYYEATDANKLPKKEQKDGYFQYDVSSVKTNFNATHLLVIQTVAAGTMRDYYGFIPTSAPRGYINVEVTLVKLSDNKIDMRYQIIETVELPEGVDWDDPENNFPEITKIVHAALEKAGDTLVKKL